MVGVVAWEGSRGVDAVPLEGTSPPAAAAAAAEAEEAAAAAEDAAAAETPALPAGGLFFRLFVRGIPGGNMPERGSAPKESPSSVGGSKC